MEAKKMNVFLVLMAVVLMAFLAMQMASAAEAPAPSPTSDATSLFVPTFFASLVALVFGFFF